MPTNYIIWDKQNKVFVAGPFLTSSAATTFATRLQGKTDHRHTDKGSTDSQFSIESVTVN